MIIEDYVSFEIAKLLKEKRFDEYCFALYNPNKELIQCGIRLNNTQVGRVEGSYSAPTLQMTMKWLKEVHNIFISISITYIVEYKKPTYLWIPCVIKQGYIDYPTMEEYMANSYEEAAETAIKYCLTNLI